MFAKKKKNELSEEELKQKRVEVNASRTEDLNQRIKQHSLELDSIKPVKGISAEILKISEFLLKINESDTIEKFQIFMQKSDAVSNASAVVAFLEKPCARESFESIKNRPKIFMSLALLALYPDKVMPDANLEDKKVLLRAKEFHIRIIDFFKANSKRSNEDHVKLSWDWIRTIHAFDEWLVKDKQMLYEKMKNDFMTWVKTIGKISKNDPSRSDWEFQAVKYQNEILKRTQDVFGSDHVDKLSKEVDELNKNFTETNFFINFDKEMGRFSCEWRLVSKEESGKKLENTQYESNLIEKLKATNVRILHELMLKENCLDFESILRLSGKSMKEVSESNREHLSRLISILSNESDTAAIASALQELFVFVCSTLNELAGENEDYCQEINLTDCSIDPTYWIHDSCILFRWILSMCKRCCAPVRDQSCCTLELCIESIEGGENLVNSFTNSFTMLFDLLNSMRSDFCNFRLKLLAAQIDGKGIAEQYELEEVQAIFSSKYEKTEKWLQPEIKNDRNHLDIMADSYLKFFDPCQDEMTESDIPELFYLDAERIQRYRSELMVSLVREAASIYLKNYLRTVKDELLIDFDEFLLELNKEFSTIKSIEEMNLVCSRNVQKLDQGKESLLKGNISRLFSNTIEDKVFLLLKNREMSKIRSALTSDPKISQPHETLTGKIYSLFRYNKSCFRTIYDEIIVKN